MNKKLIALAIAAGLAAPMAANAAPTLYGKAHVSIDSSDDGTDSNLQVVSNSSRVGVKGSEDLGNGLNAIYKYESNIGIDESSGWTGGRNHYLGLSGDFGSLRVGREDTPLKDVRSKHDAFGDMVGDFRNLVGPSSQVGNASNAWDTRLRNGISYTSPKLGGNAVIDLAYSTSQSTGVSTGTTGNDDDALSMNVTFIAGPVRVMLATETRNFVGGSDESAMRAGVQWKSGPLTVNGLYHSASDQGGVSGADRDVMGLNAKFKMGKNTFKAQYAQADDFGNTSNTGADLIAVGMDHALSKSSTIYVAYASVSNDASAGFSVTGGGHGDTVSPAAGQDPSAISIGMITNF